MSKNNISFILHEPQLSENIGACARAIKNFSFKKLVVINPKPIFPNDKILATSVGAKDIIKQSKKYDNLEKGKCLYCPWTWIRTITKDQYWVYGLVGLLAIIGGTRVLGR